MAWLRYSVYFLFIAFVTGTLTMLEVHYPGSLKMQVFVGNGDTLGTSEYSPVELIQLFLVLICGGLMGWVAQHCPAQRPLALCFGGIAATAFVRELDYFLDRNVADNAWQVLIAVIAALVIAYGWRHRRRLQIAMGRTWPSGGLALMFAGAVILFAFVHFVGHEPFWRALSGEGYQRVVKLTAEEFTELAGYYFWTIGAFEYAFEARAASRRDPEPVAVRRRRNRLKRRR